MDIALPELTTEEAERLSRAALDEARERVRRSPDFLALEMSDRIVRRGPQVFAVFGTVARELAEYSTVDAEGRLMAARPAFIDGRAVAQLPDEGRDGVLHYLYSHRRSCWTTAFIHTGWLWGRELEMTNEEIVNRISDDIDRGANVIFPKPPGWA